MTTTPTAAPQKKKPATQDAIAMLKTDHEAVNRLFTEFEAARSATRKKALVSQICAALAVHVQIEEEIFYPAIQATLKDKLLVPEAIVEHAGVKELMKQLDGVEPDGQMYDAKVKVLSEYVKHHVKEETNDMFPKVKASSINLQDLGGRMAARRDELLAQAA